MITGRFYYEEEGTLGERIHKGVEAYRKITGEYPNMAHVNPSILDEQKIIKTKDYSIFVVPDFRMDKDIVWIGVGNVKDSCIG